VPAGFLKRGENTIIVNVRNTYGMGGMLGPNDAVALHLGSTETIPLGSGWTYRVVSEDKAGGPQPPWETVGGYTTIHNAMISPLAGYPLHAALWYQGESNADRGTQYQPLLEQLIASWRKDFGAELPVVIVQLPGYGAMPDKPGPSGWSDVREAQRRVAADDPRTGLAVTMDAGERTDIHPANKAVVAERVTKVLAILTGRDTGFPDGIAPVRAQRNGDAILLEMPNDQLKVIGAARPIAFQVCSESGDCAWADASLDGALITVTVPAGVPAADVRYCWGDAPICNLFSNDDVPVSPFRMALD
jgi:sialate O-acetylesterase